jgi:predicted ABC-type sugar transport system permease subunit
MEYLILQPEVATTVFGFTSEFSQSLARFVGPVWLVATMVAVIVLRRGQLERTRQVPHKYVSGGQHQAA